MVARHIRVLVPLLTSVLAAVPLATRAGDVLDGVRERQVVRCGVAMDQPGFSEVGPDGKRQGLEIEVCRALAAAVLGAPEKVSFLTPSAADRLRDLEAGKYDVLMRTTTTTLVRDAVHRLDPTVTIFYDGQGFMVRRDLGLRSVRELDGATICVQSATTTILNLRDYFRSRDLSFTGIEFESPVSAAAGFYGGQCDALTDDASSLAGRRVKADNADDYVVLPDRMSKEPLGVMVAEADRRWADVVRWTVYALIEAEERGITAANVDDKRELPDPAMRRFLGETPEFGQAFGLDARWIYRVVKHVGDYSEIYDRTIGKRLGLERGINALWTQGGLMYAPPFR